MHNMQLMTDTVTTKKHYVMREPYDCYQDDTYTIHLYAGRESIPTDMVIEDSEGTLWNCYLIKVKYEKSTADRLEMYACTYKVI